MVWGDLISQYQHYELYRSLSSYSWTTVSRLFDETAKILSADPNHGLLSEAQRAGLRAGLPLLREHGVVDASVSDEELLYRIVARWHGAKLDEAAFRLFYRERGLSPFRTAIDVEAQTLDELRTLHQRCGAILFTGPHLGSYGAGIPILVELFRLAESAVYYQLRPQDQQALTMLMARSKMPASIKPTLVDQAEPRRDMIEHLRAGRSTFMLSDSTGIGRAKGLHRGQMLGRTFHAPTGPFRIAAAAAVPVVCVAITRAAQHGFRVHLDLLWTPDGEAPRELEPAELAELVRRKWALFEGYFEYDPLSWEGLEFWAKQPLAAV